MASKNPVENYLTEKTAGFGSAFGGAMKAGLSPDHLGGAAAKGLMGAAGGAALAGGVALGVGGANRLYDAVTKARDFRRMLDADQQLAAMHAENPRLVNQMFSTLRTFNPHFTRDPIVASQYVRNMAEDPATAGGKAVDALNFRDKMQNSLGDNVTRAAFRGTEKHPK